MNDDIARALLEVAETFTRVVVAMSDDPNKNSEYLILLIGAIQTVSKNITLIHMRKQTERWCEV